MINTSYELPSGWVWSKLGDIARIASGGTPSRTRTEFWNGKVPWVKISDIPYDGKVRGTEERITEVGLSESTARIFPRGTLLFTIFATIGKVGVLEIEAATNQAICGIRPFDEIESKFLFHYLRYAGKNLTARTHGITQANINMSIAKTLPVPIPPSEEQRRIVKAVETLLEMVATAKQAIHETKNSIRNFRQSVLLAGFRGQLTDRDPNDESANLLLERVRQGFRKKGEDLQATGKDPKKHRDDETGFLDTEGLYDLPETWAWTTIGAIETFVGSGITPLGGQNVYVSEGVPFIRSQNVHPDGLHLQDVAYVTPKMHAEMKRSHVSPGDVLLNITGASIGRSTYVPDSFSEANVNQHVCIIRTGPWIVPAYLSDFLNSPLGQEQIFATESGVTREGLNYRQIRHLKVPVAPLNEQERVAQRISELFSQASLAANAALLANTQADSLEQSILRRAFQGRLSTQDPRDPPAQRILEKITSERKRLEIVSQLRTRLVRETSRRVE